jgi:CBS-domain-containing membrane protein
MRRNWRQLAAEAIRRNDHRNALAGIVAGIGAAIAIGVMEWSSLESHTPLGIIPFATSIVLAVGSPQVEPAQPRALIGGHVVATLVGLAVLHATGPQAWAAAAAWGWRFWRCMSLARFIRRRGSIPCWWSPTTFHGRFCSRRFWRGCCC